MSDTIGIDVGGTKIAAGVLRDGKLSEPLVRPTELASGDALLDQLVDMVGAVRGPATQAVGIGVPSVVEYRTGRIRFSVNIPLADVPLRAVLTERLGLPVFVENDANVAALAEAYGPDGRLDCGDLVMFTVGTGIGGGIVISGRLFHGVTGAAPEMGHQVIAADVSGGAPAAADAFPQPASLEAHATGGALGELARRLFDDPAADAHTAVEAAQAGDPRGVEALRILGERLGLGIANAINLFDPTEIVVGGGVSAAGDLLLEPARRVAAAYTVPGVGTQTTIRLARWGPEAGMLGAALLAAQEVPTL